ncbi:hypothetical protein AB0K80_32450 [Streptomyces sp. NPDC052682]|uniref:hypothetical protein n=1 Tax=Streptomyces sp. NPDC052682 TaxID=3154954 RepID=UPI00342131C7
MAAARRGPRERDRERAVRLRRERLRAARRARERAERRRLTGVTPAEAQRHARARRLRGWAVAAVLLGAVLVALGALELAEAGEPAAGRDGAQSSMAAALALLTAGCYGVGAGAVLLRRPRRDRRNALGRYGLLAWFAVVAALPAYAYGHLLAGPAAVTAVWIVLVLVMLWIVRRDRRL